MKKVNFHLVTLFVLISIFVSLPGGAWEMCRIKCKNPEAQKYADQVYEMLFKEISPANHKKAISLLEQAVKIEPANDALWVELCAEYWEYGDTLPKKTSAERKARLAYFEKGMEAGKKALAINEASAGAHFWYGTNLASSGEMVGIMKSIWMFKDMSKHMDRSLELDPDYQIGGVARFWSEVIARVPDIAIKMVGMKPDDAIADIDEQIEKNPTYFVNYLFKARYMVRLDRMDDALKTLEFPIKTDPKSAPNKNWHSQNVSSRKDALALWKEFTGKDYPNR